MGDHGRVFVCSDRIGHRIILAGNEKIVSSRRDIFYIVDAVRTVFESAGECTMIVKSDNCIIRLIDKAIDLE